MPLFLGLSSAAADDEAPSMQFANAILTTDTHKKIAGQSITFTAARGHAGGGGQGRGDDPSQHGHHAGLFVH